jgi:hypothetical protein
VNGNYVAGLGQFGGALDGAERCLFRSAIAVVTVSRYVDFGGMQLDAHDAHDQECEGLLHDAAECHKF